MQKQDFFRDARGDGSGALAGVRVVETTTTWAGPMCGCMLADFGADVVKVEDPRGEVGRRVPPFLPGVEPPLSFMHATLNRNKRSLSLDLRRPEGREILRSLVRRADVLIENFRPGTMSAWQLGYRDLAELNPKLVYVSISGYGQFGPDHERVGYDPLAQARSGFLSLNGSPEGEPVKSPTFLADDLAGLHGAFAALAALRHRERTGEGQHIDVSLLDAMLFQSTGYLTLGAMGVDLPRMGNDFRIAAPARTFPCRDGHVMLGVLLDAHWKLLAGEIGRPELAAHPDYASGPARLAHRAEVNQLVGDWTRQRDVDAVVTQLSEVGVPVDAVRTYAQAARDPQVHARDMLQQVETPCGAEVPITGPAAKLSRTPTRVREAAPALGQHNREILEEIGCDANQIEALERAGTI